MPLPKVSVAQRDFSAGQIDISMKRDEESEVFKKGLRQCSNFRILNSNKLQQRLGRTAKFLDGPRVEEVLMAPGQIFYLVFGNHALSVYNAAGTRVFTSTKLGDGATTIPWTAASVVAQGGPRWDIYLYSIYIAYDEGFPANVPQILTWDGISQTSTWQLATYTERIVGDGQKRTPFYRITPVGITLQPSVVGAHGGVATITASSPIFTAAHVGTRVRYIGRQLLITAVAGPPSATASIIFEETVFPSVAVNTNSVPDIRNLVSVGDVVIGAVSGAKAQVTAVTGAVNFTAQLLNGNVFLVGAQDIITGPGGNLGTPTAVVAGNPLPVTIWDDEVMNGFRGYPSSVAVDQGRLIFSNFPSVPAGIAWSAIADLIDLYVLPFGIAPNNAIFEITPNKNQVQDVVAGNEGSEFIFCDNAVFGIPINAQNPLSGTSGVNFQKISDDGAANVQPRRMQNLIVYINAGGKSVRGIMTVGAFNRANESRDLSQYHSDLFKSPVAIACPTADDPNFTERYFYVLNSDNTIAVGTVDVENGNVKPNTLPGWVPESGTGVVKWVSARGPNMMFTTSYPSTTSTIAELRDFSQYLDAGLAYNAVPAPFTPPGGKGPLWWMAGGTCTVMDQGTRQMGLYQIDANGFLVPQNFGGENLASAQLVVGQAWTGIVEPWIPAPGPGNDVKQRMVRIKIARISAYIVNSTGFLWTRLFSGPLVPVTSPAYLPLGAVQGTRRVTTYNQDDDATQPPPLREGAEFWRPAGRSFDPRIALVKDTSGPLTILELGAETTV